jgi:RNA polymerase sigma-70 factor (ECF subfamily)
MEYDQAISAAGLCRPSNAKVTSDEVLVGLIAKGDKDAIRLLFVRHNLRVFRFILRIVHDEAAAEDLLNEVFVDVWRDAGRFEARSKVSTWILGIARFKALSSLRKRSYAQLDDEAADALEDPADNAEALLQRADRAAIVQACLKQLSSAHREVIDLVYYHEQSIADVARIVGVPENTVKTRVFYARKRIAELMAERGVDGASL